MRIAFVGVGHHHTPFYLEPVRAMPEHTVVGVSDPEPEVARRLAGSLGCGWAAEYGDLLEQTRPDFVFALGRHCDMAAEADALIERGIPFAIEKPAGLTFGEVQRLAQRAAQRQAF